MFYPLSPSGTILQDYVPDTQDVDIDVVEIPSSAFHYEAPSYCSFIATPTPHIPTSPLTTIHLFSISIPLSFQRMLYKWNHKVCYLLRLAFFTPHNFLAILPGLSVTQQFFFIAEQNFMVWIYLMYLIIYLPQDIWVVSSFQLL